ncbi:MAG: HEAT repeat domain-containing protein [Planctomycetota bacterium]
MKKNLRDHKVEFLYVYTREPHASQRMGRNDFRDERQTRSVADRIKNAVRCNKKYKFTIPWIIDDMKCTIQKAYGGLPNSGFVIRSDGVVAFKQHWANGKHLEREVKKLHPPSFYLASKKDQKILLKIFEAGVRLTRSRETAGRLEAAEELAGFTFPALLPRLGAGLHDRDPGVRTKVWELLGGLVKIPLPFDPEAEEKAGTKQAEAVVAWLKEAEDTYKWDRRKKCFVPKKRSKKPSRSKKSSRAKDEEGEF